MVDPQIYFKRRCELAKYLKDGFILFCGENKVSMHYQSNFHPFVQDSSA